MLSLPKKLLATTFLPLCFLITPLSSLAGNVTGQQTVQTSVLNSCIILSVDTLNFGTSFDPVKSTSIPIIRHITLRCTQDSTGWIGISEGNNPGTGSSCDNPVRQLISNSGNGIKLGYNLTYDNSSVNWGCSQASGRAFTSTSAGTDIDVQAVGVIPSGQDVPAGDYEDQLTITVNF